MLQFVNYDIVFQEIPDEVTLAINLANCPNRCKGCHSAYLMENTGDVLDEETLSGILDKYKHAITCICFMGGDAEPGEVEHVAGFIHRISNGKLKTGWYSGKEMLPEKCDLRSFNYIKLGPYIQHLGGLDSLTTNQRFYRVENNELIDMTYRFRKTRFQEEKSA